MKRLVAGSMALFSFLVMACSDAQSDTQAANDETVGATDDALKWKPVICTPTECTINGMTCTCCGNVADCREATKKK